MVIVGSGAVAGVTSCHLMLTGVLVGLSSIPAVILARALLRRDLVLGLLLSRENGPLGGQSCLFLLQVENGPVEHIIVLEALPIEQLLEKPLQVSIIRTVFEAEGAAVLKVGTELSRITLAELLRRSRHFSIHDTLVLLLLGIGLESLPGKRSPDEIHEDIAEGFEVVAAALFDAHVRVDRRVARRSSQILVLAVWDMLVRPRIAVLLGQAEIDNVNYGLTLPEANEKVVRLYVAMYEGLGVDIFQPAKQLICQHQDSFELKSSSAIIEKVFERRTEEIENHHIVISFNAVPPNIRDAHCKRKGKRDSGCVG